MSRVGGNPPDILAMATFHRASRISAVLTGRSGALMTLCTAVPKGSLNRMQVPLSRPSITQADIAAVLEVLNSPSLSLGPKLAAFERAMADYSGTAEAVAVNSGTSGLHLCLAAAGIKPGDEVITTPFSFVASANCALYQGATPVFADIDPLTLNIDPNQVEARLTARTRALVPVDVFGQPAPIEDLMVIA